MLVFSFTAEIIMGALIEPQLYFICLVSFIHVYSRNVIVHVSSLGFICTQASTGSE